MFEAMVYILRVGCPWRDLPAIYGPWSSVYTRWRRWSVAGLWAKLLRVLGTRRSRQIEIFGYQPYQGTSEREQSCWRSTKSSHRPHQGRSEHQAERLGGWLRSSHQPELGSGTTGRCHRRTNVVTPAVARNDHRDRQRLRLRWLSRRVAALWQSCVHSAALQSAQASQLASRPLPKTPQGGELIPTLEALPQSRDEV